MNHLTYQFKQRMGKILKEYRLKNGLSHEMVMNYLSEHGFQSVRPTTLYSWENGQSMPNVYTFLQLCRLYHIEDILRTFELHYIPIGNEPFHNLSSKEKELLIAYRGQPSMHPAVDRLLNLPHKASHFH
ncbi:MAG: helix-turn-helix transcriptional regulator [Lachnospira sp.]|nr:helix-turn-helix transcriptional regulator [Lachnospira sp.]